MALFCTKNSISEDRYFLSVGKLRINVIISHSNPKKGISGLQWTTFYQNTCIPHPHNISGISAFSQGRHISTLGFTHIPHPQHIRLFSSVFIQQHLLPTAREGNVSTVVCQSSCSQMASWLLGHCSSLLWRGWYACYLNGFLFITCNRIMQLQRKEILLLIGKYISEKD